MNTDRKSWNSTLRPISKKRLAQMQAGTWKPKPRKPMKTMSAKAKARVKDYRERAFAEFGERCELCGVRLPRANLVIHHYKELRKTGNDSIDNLCVLCYHCHNDTHLDKAHFEYTRNKIEIRRKTLYNKGISEGGTQHGEEKMP